MYCPSWPARCSKSSKQLRREEKRTTVSWMKKTLKCITPQACLLLWIPATQAVVSCLTTWPTSSAQWLWWFQISRPFVKSRLCLKVSTKMRCWLKRSLLSTSWWRTSSASSLTMTLPCVRLSQYLTPAAALKASSLTSMNTPLSSRLSGTWTSPSSLLMTSYFSTPCSKTYSQKTRSQK